MVERGGFPRNRMLQVRLVAMDIKGFSCRYNDPTSLFFYRTELIKAVERTELYPIAIENGVAAVQALGDELRLAFPADEFSFEELLSFVIETQTQLKKSAVAIRSVLLNGNLGFYECHGCCYLAGGLALKAQRWMKGLDGGALAADQHFVGSETEIRAGDRAFVKRGIGASETGEAPLECQTVPSRLSHFVVAVGLRPPPDDPREAVDVVNRALQVPWPRRSTPLSYSVSVSPYSVLVALRDAGANSAKALIEGVSLSAPAVRTSSVAAAVCSGDLIDMKTSWVGSGTPNFEGPAAVRAARILEGSAAGVLALSEEVLDIWGDHSGFVKREIIGKHNEKFLVRELIGRFQASQTRTNEEQEKLKDDLHRVAEAAHGIIKGLPKLIVCLRKYLNLPEGKDAPGSSEIVYQLLHEVRAVDLVEAINFCDADLARPPPMEKERLALHSLLRTILPFTVDWRSHILQLRERIKNKEQVAELPFFTTTLAEAILAGAEGRPMEFSVDEWFRKLLGRGGIVAPYEPDGDATLLRQRVLDTLATRLNVTATEPDEKLRQINQKISAKIRSPQRSQVRYHLLFIDTDFGDSAGTFWGYIQPALNQDVPTLLLVRLYGNSATNSEESDLNEWLEQIFTPD